MKNHDATTVVGWLLAAGIGISLVGCGIYSFSGSTLPTHIRTVAVPLFDDDTPEFGIAQDLTDAVIDAITKDNTLKIANPPGHDSMLRGRILRITDGPGQYNRDETVTDYRVTVNVHVSFEDIREQKILWEDTLSQWGSYSSDREEGIRSALEKIATDILTRTVSSW